MLQNLFHVPVWIVVLLMGGLFGASFAPPKRKGAVLLCIAGGALLAGLFAYFQVWGQKSLPVRGYGVMILFGFLFGVGMAAARARQIGVEPRHCLDMAIWGVIIGLSGARVFHIAMNWELFDPFAGGQFEWARIADMFKLWEGGLVFFGTFVTVIPWAYFYCRIHKLPRLAFLDLAAPSLIAGQAFGRIGCFLNGCCFGQVCDLPWQVQFPPNSPPYFFQRDEGLLAAGASQSLGVHPTQIYASIAAALTAAFLYAYWPRRQYDGQVISLMLIMAGATRFFEELLRSDEPAVFPAIASWITIAQWFALVFIAVGTAMLFYFRSRKAALREPLAA